MRSEWTSRAIWERAWEVVRDEGVRSLWFKILGETVYRRMVLCELLLDDPVPNPRASTSVVVGRLGKDDVEEYVAVRPGSDRAEFLRRLEDGHRCFAVRIDERIVHCCWVAMGKARIDYLDCVIALRPDEAYSYEAYTRPEARGLNITAHCAACKARYLRDSGVKRMIAAIVPEGRSAIRANQKAGYRRFGMIGCVGVGRWRNYFCRTQAGSLPVARQPRW